MAPTGKTSDPFAAPKGRFLHESDRSSDHARFTGLLPRRVREEVLWCPPTLPGIAGTVGVWGNNDLRQRNVPLDVSNVKAVSTGAWHSLALLGDGTVRGWGLDSGWPKFASDGLSVQAISAGASFLGAARRRIFGGRKNTDGQANVAGGHFFSAIAAGGLHGLALTVDSTVVALATTPTVSVRCLGEWGGYWRLRQGWRIRWRWRRRPYLLLG